MGPHCEPHYLYGILILYTPISTDFGNDVGCIAVADDISMVYVGSDDCTVRALSFEGKPPPPPPQASPMAIFCTQTRAHIGSPSWPRPTKRPSHDHDEAVLSLYSLACDRGILGMPASVITQHAYVQKGAATALLAQWPALSERRHLHQ